MDFWRVACAACFGRTKSAGHDPENGLWALVVAFALTLGFLPDWLAGSTKTAGSVQPEKYNLISR
jgi:hypothetical protein